VANFFLTQTVAPRADAVKKCEKRSKLKFSGWFAESGIQDPESRNPKIPHQIF